MRGVDEGNEWRTIYLEKKEKEEGGSEIERGDNSANVPASVHATLGAQRLAPTQEACLCYS